MPRKTPSSLRLSFWSLLALCASLLALPSQAEKADRDQPMQIEADSMRHDEARQLTQFTGKVVATKGTLVLRAARMDVQQDAYATTQQKLKGTVWSSGCKSWYQNAQGQIDTLWPGYTWEYWLQSRRFQVSDYL